MAFLLFAARKLQIKRDLNAKNYELMNISSQYASAHKKVAEQQERVSNLKNQASIFAQQIQNNYAQMGAESMNQLLANGNATKDDYQTAMKSFNDAQYFGTIVGNIFNKLSECTAEHTEKVQLAQLQAFEQQLEMKKTAIENEVKLLESEYSTYDSAVKESAKAAAPQFGLA